MVLSLVEDVSAERVEMLASRIPEKGGIDAYERLLGCAMEGDTTCLRDRITSKKLGGSSIRC